MADPFRPCILIPTYDNAATLRRVVERAGRCGTPVLVVDDGSGPDAQAVARALEHENKARVVWRPVNGGKGAAVKAGFAAARADGYTHALQVDADGQHDLDRIGAMLAAARAHPAALVLARPVFAAEAPRGRRIGREITNFWVAVETFGRPIADAMIGFRVYPLAAAEAAQARGDRMEFDIEIAVRMVWAGVLVLNLPVAVRYLSAEEGGVSHFRMVRDNLRITWLHTRLVTEAMVRKILLWQRFGKRIEAEG
ncbi:MAG: glycosyltransferase [Deltaproteobacteria bacterium]|nr:glycosyltransferase [Deltaproteobacteria bacterium]